LGTAAPTHGKIEERSFYVQRAESDGRSFGSVAAMFHSNASAELPQVNNKNNLTKRITFQMKTERTTGEPERAGRATQIGAMVITGLVAFIWMYFGRLYLIHDPDEWKIANQQLGYPLYIIPLIGVTHILGGVGLLIPKAPRLTGWVYAGLVINLTLAFYSQLNGGASAWDEFDPILVMAFVFASYALRRYMPANRWSI
jgi:uncharacterized membrane protein YphA (DoxX/SURF4 family)